MPHRINTSPTVPPRIMPISASVLKSGFWGESSITAFNVASVAAIVAFGGIVKFPWSRDRCWVVLRGAPRATAESKLRMKRL